MHCSFIKLVADVWSYWWLLAVYKFLGIALKKTKEISIGYLLKTTDSESSVCHWTET